MKKNKGWFNICIFIFITIAVIALYRFYNSKSDKQFIIQNKNIDIRIAEHFKINYTLSDGFSSVEWSSSDTNVATVDQNGVINGVNYGIAIIIGKVSLGSEEIYQNVVVNVYSGDKNIELQKVLFPEGEVLMRLNSNFKITYSLVPEKAFVTSLKYDVDDDSIVEVYDNMLVSKKVGVTDVKITVNDIYTSRIIVNVTDDIVENKIIKKLESVDFKEKEIILEMNEKKQLDYLIKPIDAYVGKMVWLSSNENIVTVGDGEIFAKSPGEAMITLLVNDSISASIKINVIVNADEIKVNHYPKTLLRIGETSKIMASVLPENATDKIIQYKSSNPSVAIVDNSGNITGKSSGTSKIILSTNNGKELSINVNVLSSYGVIRGTGNLWGYNSLNEKIPVRAGVEFFSQLAKGGKGTLSGNIYTYLSSGTKYTYDINKSVLTVNNTKVMTRFYYPLNTDLSSLNMFVFMGGDGENNFSGFFNDIEKDKSIIKSAGLVVLISEGSRYNTSFDQYAANCVVDFSKIIFNQKDSIRKSIGGFSTGGTKVFWTADKYDFDRVIVYSSYFNWPESTKNLKNKEIIFYIPNKDTLYNQAKSTLSDLKKMGYSNVTVVSNSNEISNKFKDSFLIINPGSLMVSAHTTENVVKSHMFSYANE